VDGRLDRVVAAGPLPLAVGQIREAVATTRPHAVAARAVVQEQAAADLLRLGALVQLVFAQRRETLVQRRELCVLRLHVAIPLRVRRPLAEARKRTESGVVQEIAERKYHRRHEQTHPPHRQRVVVFLDAVEIVTGRFHHLLRLGAIRQQQP
jgi:hypothetical protein